MRVICDTYKQNKKQDCCNDCKHVKQHTHNSTCYFTCWSNDDCKCISISEIRKQKLNKLYENR